MTWPNTTISTSNVDSGSDTPANARAQIYDAITAVNSMISDGPTRGEVQIYTGGTRVYTASAVQRIRANAAINYQIGTTIVSSILDNGELVIQPGTYVIDVLSSQGTGDWQFQSNNTSIGMPSGTSVNYTTPGSGYSAAFTTVGGANTVVTVTAVMSANLNTLSGAAGYPNYYRITRIA